jgi:spore coat polysaccharide biosynthesis protein SpsF
LVKYLCIIQARINSSRLPGKVMLDLAGKTLLERAYNSVCKSKKINKIVVATSNLDQDDIIENKLRLLGIDCFRGDLNNVLKRFFNASEVYQAINIVRVTADNPMMDAQVIDDLISHYEENDCNYSMFSNGVYGLSTEVFSKKILDEAFDNSNNDYEKEHVTPYILNNGKPSVIDMIKKYRKPEIRATIDTLEDYIKLQNFYLSCKENLTEPNIDSFILYMTKRNFLNE